MSDSSNIEWTDATSHTKTAAKRIGMSVTEYVQLKRDGLKYCWRCRAWRAGAMFGIDSSRGDGLTATCVTCRRVSPVQMTLIRETPAERDRRRYATDSDYRAERRQHAHARRRGVEPLPLAGIEALTEKFDGLCAYCLARASTWDHVVPVSKGGRTIPGNIVPACHSCNSRKRDRDVYDFIEQTGVVLSAALEAELAFGLEWGQLE